MVHFNKELNTVQLTLWFRSNFAFVPFQLTLKALSLHMSHSTFYSPVTRVTETLHLLLLLRPLHILEAIVDQPVLIKRLLGKTVERILELKIKLHC